MNSNFKLLDVVALLRDIPEQHLLQGQVGTIVELLDEHVYEVEFSNPKGETTSSIAIFAKDLLLLHYEVEMTA